MKMPERRYPMKPVRLMIFDLDGTLVTSGDDLARAINHMLETLDKPALPPERIMSLVGDGVETLVRRSLGDASPGHYDKALELFSAYYAEHILDATSLYPGVEEVLQHFQDKHKVIITNKHILFARRITDGLNITRYFDDIIGADSTPYTKPDARLLLPLLDTFGASRAETVVIGDGVNDILLARNTGTISCALFQGLSAGHILRELKPDFACNDIREVMGIFH
jgi:phosphoglycolate phosphatase